MSTRGVRLEHGIRRYAERVADRRYIVFVSAILLTIVASLGLPKLAFQTDYRTWWSEDAPTLVAFDRMVERFGNDDQALIVVRDPERGMLDNHALGTVSRLTEALIRVEGVKRVDSLTNFPTIRASRIEHESPALAVGPGFVAASGDRHEVFVWSGDALARRTFAGHEGLVERLAVGASGRWLYSGSVDRTARIWDVKSGEVKAVLRGFPAAVSAVLPSADETRVYVGSFGKVTCFDAQTGAVLWRAGEHRDFVTALLLSPDGSRLYSASESIEVLDPSSGRTLERWTTPGSFVTALVTTADGRVVIAARDDGSVQVHDPLQLHELTKVPGTAALALALAPTGQAVVVGFSDGTVRVVALEGDEPPVVSRLHDDWVNDLVVTPDGRVFAGSRDRNVSLFVPGQGPRQELLAAHRGSVRRVAADARRFYSLGDEGDLYVWTAEDGALVARLSRTAEPRVAPAAMALGPAVGRLDVYDGFRYPLDLEVAGTAAGRIAGGSFRKLEGLPVPEAKACDGDGDCGAGFCDYEAESPTCATPMRVEAFLAGTRVSVWVGETQLLADHAVTLRIPSEEPFSVLDVALPAADPKTSVGGFRAAFAGPAVSAAIASTFGDAVGDDTWIGPDEASVMIQTLHGAGTPPEEALRFLTSQAQRVSSPLSLPLQPFRLRETAHNLMRPPDPQALGAVLNRARDATIVLVTLHPAEGAQSQLEHQAAVRHRIEALLAPEAAASGFVFHLAGDIVQDTTGLEYAQKDLERLLPLFFGVIALLLLVIYRRLSGVLLPLGLVGLSIAMAMGVAGHVGAALDNMTSIVPQIVLASCIGDAVHLFNAYAEGVGKGQSARHATTEAVVENFWPCLWTSVSTALGFFSLSWSAIQPVARFGWMSGIGVIAAFLMCFTVMPAVMAMLPVSKKKAADTQPGGFDAWMVRRMTALGRYVTRTAGTIVVIAAVVVGGSFWGLRNLAFDSNPIEFFDTDAPFRQACDFIEAHISGPAVARIEVEAGAPGGVRKVEYLERLARLTDYLHAQPEVVGVTSFSDVMKGMNRAMNQDLDERYGVPERDGISSAYYDAYTFSLRAGMDLTNRVSADESATLVDVRLKNQTSGQTLAWGARVKDWAEREIPGTAVTVTGKNWLFANVVKEISRGMFENVGSAVLLIGAFMFLIAGSFRLGVIASAANVLPLVMTVGFLTLSGKTLDLSIIVSCCVAIGIVVDDSIHFITRYKLLRGEGLDHETAIVHTLRDVGKAMVYTTVILVSGLLMFLWTDFVLNQHFGITVALMLTLGLTFDLFVLPASIVLLERARGEPVRDADEVASTGVIVK